MLLLDTHPQHCSCVILKDGSVIFILSCWFTRSCNQSLFLYLRRKDGESNPRGEKTPKEIYLNDKSINGCLKSLGVG